MIVLTPPWGTVVEHERRNRILISVYAFAYEYCCHSIVDDQTYDTLARKINTQLWTGQPALDIFFRTHYSADTGMWIRQHPNQDGIERIYRNYFQR